MDGIERIKILSSQITDKALLEIINYLITRKDMSEKYLNEEKSLKQMVEFIKDLAQKEAKDGMAMIEDKVVFGWAIHYWDEPNEKLRLVSKTETKNQMQEQNNKIKKVKKDSTAKEWHAEGQLSIFDVH